MTEQIINFLQNPIFLSFLGSILATIVALIATMFIHRFVTRTVRGLHGRWAFNRSPLTAYCRVRHDTSTGPVIGRLGPIEAAGVSVFYDVQTKDGVVTWQDYYLWQHVEDLVRKCQTTVHDKDTNNFADSDSGAEE